MEVSSTELGVNEISKVIKILGVTFALNYSLFCKLNFESIEKSLRGLLKGWSWRVLTQGCSHFKQKRVYKKYFIIFFNLFGRENIN